jgi:hypothetical protein
MTSTQFRKYQPPPWQVEAHTPWGQQNELFHDEKYFFLSTNRGSSVGIATGYGLDDHGVGVRVPMGEEFSLLHGIPTGSGAHPASYPLGTWGSFPGGKVAGAWIWPLTNSCRGQENVGLYIHSPIYLYGVVLNKLSTGKILPILPLPRVWRTNWAMYIPFYFNVSATFRWQYHYTNHALMTE